MLCTRIIQSDYTSVDLGKEANGISLDLGSQIDEDYKTYLEQFGT
jgi:hypothetical protein